MNNPHVKHLIYDPVTFMGEEIPAADCEGTYDACFDECKGKKTNKVSLPYIFRDQEMNSGCQGRSLKAGEVGSRGSCHISRRYIMFD